jgi:hypothetical protein
MAGDDLIELGVKAMGRPCWNGTSIASKREDYGTV